MITKLIVHCVFFIFFIKSVLFSQIIYNKDVDVLVNKISTVYAGYSTKIESKAFFKMVEEIKKSKSIDTFANLSKLTSYFKDHHLSLFQKFSLKEIDSNVCKKNLTDILLYEKKGNRKNFYEGFWINEMNKSIIYLKVDNQGCYKGYVIESKNNIPVGFCILKFEKKITNKILTDYINTEANYRVFVSSFFKSSSTLIVSSYGKWKRLDNYYEGFLSNINEIKFEPLIKMLDSNNILIRMPDFNGKSIKIYDSLIKLNEDAIRKSKNLLLDIRNNGGGFINCFFEIIPYICTNTILECAGETLSSDDLIEDTKKRREKYVQKKDTGTVLEFDKYLKKLVSNKGQLIASDYDSIKCEPKQNSIKNVGLIINHGCRSAAELMILYFKQSKKVTVFGEASAGAVDYLNMFTYSLPVSKFTLWVGTVKRKITDKQPSYDNSGIKPDVEISDEENNWVEFVKNYYGEN